MRIAIVGATGAVGTQMLRVLQEREFETTEVRMFASPRSKGRELEFSGRVYACRTLEPGCFHGVQIAFFDAADAVSSEWVPRAAQEGAWVIDNSGVFRLEKDVPLVVPELTDSTFVKELRTRRSRGGHAKILAGPNCTTVQLVLALQPIRDLFGLKRVVVSTYQSTSGAGAQAMEELKNQTQASLKGQPVEKSVFPHPIAFNCIPQIGAFKDEGYTSEELKVIAETRKLLGLPSLAITATAVRVPTFSCHAESVNVECEREPDLESLRAAYRNSAGIELQDDPSRGVYPLGIDCQDRDAVCVGRIRRDASVNRGLNLWVVSDNLRKGAALNAVQVGEMLVQNGLA